MILALIFVIIFSNAYSQNIGINTSGVPANAGAALDIEFEDKGLLIPRVDIADLSNYAPISGPATESMLVYNTNTTTGRGFYYWDGAEWIHLMSPGGAPSTSGDAWELLGNAGTNPATNFIGTTDNQSLSVRTNNSIRFTFTNNGRLRAHVDGTAGQPAYAFNGGTGQTMGMYRIGADILGFSTTSTERMRINQVGQVGVGLNNPSARLHVSGLNQNLSQPGEAAQGLLWIGGKNNQDDNQFINFRNPSVSDGTVPGMSWWSPDIVFGRYRNEAFWSFKETHGTPLGNDTKDIIRAHINDAGGFQNLDRVVIAPDLGNVGIGTTAPTQKLDIDGQIRIRGGAPGAGKVLTSAADGTATWEVPASGASGTVNQTFFNSGTFVRTATGNATWVVPVGVTRIRVFLVGGGGGGHNGDNQRNTGGSAGIVTGDFEVVPGETLYLRVGAGGQGYTNTSHAVGGGGSYIKRGSHTGTWIAAAGGGGGARRGSNGNGDGLPGGTAFGTGIDGQNGTTGCCSAGGSNFIGLLFGASSYVGRTPNSGTITTMPGASARDFTASYNASVVYGEGGSQFGGNGSNGIVVIQW
ncbi:MAG: hypothetical protein JJT77_10100 [Crocinitomicaceae bacterium]|nr:hypothetical protein [Crocinitomicaceae bacterium]